jgi:hypothetical protein
MAKGLTSIGLAFGVNYFYFIIDKCGYAHNIYETNKKDIMNEQTDTPRPINKFMSYGWCNTKGDYIPMGECVTYEDYERERLASLEELTAAREQRERLAEAAKAVKGVTWQASLDYGNPTEWEAAWQKLDQALQSLNPEPNERL